MPHQSGLHQADRSMEAAVSSLGMPARAALVCHLSPIRPQRLAAVYAISSNWIMMASSTKQSLSAHHTRGLEANRLHNGIGRYVGIGKRAAICRFADRGRISNLLYPRIP